MTRRGKRTTKKQSVDTAGGVSIGNDVNAGGDFVGRDSTVANITNHIHNHYSALKTSSSHRKSDPQALETNVVNTLITFYHRWFPYMVLLVVLQMVFVPLLFVIPDLWPLLILPGGMMIGLF